MCRRRVNVQDWPVDHPIQLFGYAIPQIMLSAQAYENYRLNYMYDKGWWPNALECHKMIRLLEQWGVREARTPDVACLIESRASEDWWRAKLVGKPNVIHVPDNLAAVGNSAIKRAG